MKEHIDSNMIGPAEASLFRSGDQIREDVQALIDQNDLIRPKDIDVSVENGVVTLKGRVKDKLAGEEAVQAAREVLGVIEVRNELEIGG